MIRLQTLVLVASTMLIGSVGLGISRAQHIDVLAQQLNGQLVTGSANFDSSQWTLGLRVFHRDFDSDFAINNPGFDSIGAGSPDMPAGAQALPGNTDLSRDFLPMTIGDASQNLFYWNGQDTDGVTGLTAADVAFGPLPGPNYTLSLFDKSNAKHSVNGANSVVAGGVIDTTAADGAMHRHRFWFLEDGDGNSGTLPADGIYLLAMRLRMTGLADSLPVFMIFGTPSSSIAAEDDAAVPWVLHQLNLPGDYNHSGVVDAADYVVWRDMNGQSGTGLAADGDGDQVVDQADYNVWRQHFGQASQLIVSDATTASSYNGLASGPVPEPCGAISIVVAILIFALKGRFRQRRQWQANYPKYSCQAA